MARTWRSWKPGTPLARMPNGAATAETDRRSLQKCKAELRREPAVPFGVFVPENQTQDFRETPASRVRCSTVSGSPDADETTRTLLRDGRARKTESVPAVGRRAFATWAAWAKLLDARWALPSARRGAGDPAPNERGQTLPSRATQPRAEAERKRAETHAVSGNITGGDERRTGDVTEDTRLGSGDQGAATHRPWIALRDQRRGRVRSAWPSAWARHVAAAVVRAMPPLLGQQLPGGTDRPPAHGGWCWRCPLSSGLAERWPMRGGGEGGGPVRTGS